MVESSFSDKLECLQYRPLYAYVYVDIHTLLQMDLMINNSRQKIWIMLL